jgi:hypothetical protein
MSVGKSGNRIWFKSDQMLSDVTDAVEFRVTKSWFTNKFKVQAAFKVYASWDGKQVFRWKTIGIYKSADTASNALTHAMHIKGIVPIEETLYL